MKLAKFRRPRKNSKLDRWLINKSSVEYITSTAPQQRFSSQNLRGENTSLAFFFLYRTTGSSGVRCLLFSAGLVDQFTNGGLWNHQRRTLDIILR